MLWSWSVFLTNLGSLSLLHMFISVLVCQRLIINRNVIAKYWETYLERLPTVNLFLALFFLQIVFLTIGLFHGQLLTICYFLFERFLWKPRKLEPTMKLFPKWFFHCLLRFRHQCTTSFIHLNPTAKEKKFVKKSESEIKTAKEMKVIFVLSKKSLIHAVNRLEYSPLWPFSISISIWWWWWWWMKTESSDWCSHTCFPLSNFLPISQLYWC